jgi:REP element-mobilizing transposase RayT
MPSTYLSLHYHIVFATKNREPLLDQSWRLRLHEYLGGTVRGLGGVAEEVGGVEDHVHLLIALKSTHSLADVMRELKKGSSIWVHREIGDPSFAWQEGYGAFTVSASSRAMVRQYIANQEVHHQATSFREELVAILEKAAVEYDEKYLD